MYYFLEIMRSVLAVTFNFKFISFNYSFIILNVINIYINFITTTLNKKLTADEEKYFNYGHFIEPFHIKFAKK